MVSILLVLVFILQRGLLGVSSHSASGPYHYLSAKRFFPLLKCDKKKSPTETFALKFLLFPFSYQESPLKRVCAA